MGLIGRTLLIEIASSALLGTTLFTFVLFLQRVSRLFEQLVRGSASPEQVLFIFALSLPPALMFTIPVGVLVGTLIFWNVFLDRLSFRYRWFRRFATAPPLCIVLDGKLLRRNMRKEYITDEELWAQLRQEGIESLDEVKAVYLETDGQFSVVKRK